MSSRSILFCLFLSVTFVTGSVLPNNDEWTNTQEREALEEGRLALPEIRGRQHRSVSSLNNAECQEGSPPGVSYSGTKSVTISGKQCQVWAVLQPHNHTFTEVGEHNHCRNPIGYKFGVWCFTTDPDMRWELCYVPRCDLTYNCQEGARTVGASYAGNMNVTVSGKTCQAVSYTHLTLPTILLV